jgi:N-carbamoylputrescine amidase
MIFAPRGFLRFGTSMIRANASARAPIRVSCIQFAPQIGAVAANVARASDLVRAAAAEGSRLIVLPELASTGYVFESAAEAAALAEPVPGGPTTRAWAALAAELGVHIVAGIAEAAGETLYNAAVIVGPEGYLGTYRKAHLWDQENVFFAKGDLGFPVFDTALGMVGVAI